jgi:hypothetical protein
MAEIFIKALVECKLYEIKNKKYIIENKQKEKTTLNIIII